MSKALFKNVVILFASIALIAVVCIPLQKKFQSARLHKINRIAPEVRMVSKSGISIPNGYAIVGESYVSSNGRRIVFLVEDESKSTRLVLWEEGVGVHFISAIEEKVTDSVSFSDDGLKIAYFSIIDENLSKLFLWEDGFGVNQLLDDLFLDSWHLRFSTDGTRLIITPKGATSNYRGLVSGDDNVEIPYVSGSILLLDFIPELSITMLSGFDGVSNKSININDIKLSTPFDIDGDGSADLVTFNSSITPPVWRAYTTGGFDGIAFKPASERGRVFSWRFGKHGGIPVIGDYNGDGVQDFALFFPGLNSDWSGPEKNWKIYFSKGKEVDAILKVTWGSGDARAVHADYNGDGRTDIATYSPSLGILHILFSGGDFQVAKAQQGISGYGHLARLGGDGFLPLTGDVNGDGRSEFVLFNNGLWQVYGLTDLNDGVSLHAEFHFGSKGDIPFLGDFNCDGKAEAVVYNPKRRRWFIRYSKEEIKNLRWGIEGGEPIVADFSGNGCADISLYSNSPHPSWHILNMSLYKHVRDVFDTSSPVTIKIPWGSLDDIPVQILLRRHQHGLM
jgi:hypothetical protein